MEKEKIIQSDLFRQIYDHLVRFVLGEGRVIAGWEKGLVGTCAGEKVLWS